MITAISTMLLLALLIGAVVGVLAMQIATMVWLTFFTGFPVPDTHNHVGLRWLIPGYVILWVVRCNRDAI